MSNVKELGILIEHCHCMGHDLEKVFNLWSYFGLNLNNQLPADSVFPTQFNTEITEENPAQITRNNETIQFYFGTSPTNIKPTERTSEITALLEMIGRTQNKLDISLMEYFPFDTDYDSIWNELENALKVAILKNVKINILVSKWNMTNAYVIPSLKSIQSFSSICQDASVCNGTFTVKMIEFPTPDQMQHEEKYYTVNNAKYVIQDEEWVYISTSDWNQNSFYRV
jgi:phospholipase D3/4